MKMRLKYALFQHKDIIIETCQVLIEELTDTSSIDSEIEKLTKELSKLSNQIREHIQKNAESELNQVEYNKTYDELTEMFSKKKNTHQKLKQKRSYQQGRAEVMTAFIKGIEERTEPIDYFDESVWKLTIEKVTIFHDGRMIFQFVDGTEIEG